MNRVLLITGLLFSINLFSQEYLSPEHISMRDGLSYRAVNSITKDSEGYLWVCTEEGLNRYDGVNWTIYKNQPDDSTSINIDFVWNVIEDSDGNLVVGLKGQMGFFDRKNNTFKRARIGEKEINQEYSTSQLFNTPSKDIYALAVKNEIWSFKKAKKLTLLKYKGDGQFEVITEDMDKIVTGPDPVMNESYTIWYVYSWAREEYVFVNFETRKVYVIPFKSFGGNKEIPIDKNGKFWYPALNSKQDGLLDHFDLPSDIPLKDWIHWTLDNYNNIWLTTKSERVYKFDVRQNVIKHSGEFDLDNFYLGYELFEDNEGILWIPYILGLTKIKRRKHYFENHLVDPRGKNKFLNSGSEFYSLAQHSKDTIFGLFDYNGLIAIDPRTGNDSRRPYYLNTRYNILATNQMMVASEDGNLWIGEAKNRITRFNPVNKEFLRISIPDSLIPPKGPKRQGAVTMSLHLGNDKKLWFINSTGQLWSLDQTTLTFSVDTSQNFHRGVIGIADRGMWICTDELLIRKDENNNTVGQYELPERGATKNQIEVFKTVPYQDKVWVGTRRGLLEFDTLSKTFNQYTVANGLPVDIIYTIIPYGDDLWMGTQYGLCRFNIRSKEIKTFYTADGLTHNEFNRESALKARDGKLYFGGINGINAFYPETLDSLVRLEASPLVWTQFSKLDRKSDTLEVLSSHQLNTSSPVKLYHGDKSFSFHYALLSYSNPKENTYHYFLDGYEQDWNYSGNTTVVNYPSLPPGSYILRIKAKDPQGNEATNELAIPIIVYGPWWSTWWAISGFIIFLVSALIGYNRWRTINFKKQKKVLEEKVAQRTVEYKEQKERAERSEKFKEQFLANMSHEIRTPMHAISGMTNILARNDHPKHQDKFLNAIQQSSGNLLVILNDILDLSKIEAGKIEIEKIPINPTQVIKNVIDILKHKAEAKGLTLQSFIDEKIPELVTGDPTRLSQILLNLFGNAIKFTERGSVCLHLNLINEKLQFKIKDTGIGIPPDKLENVFETFEQVSKSTARKYGGTGLGLTITKQLVELQNGRLWVESQEKVGSTFFFELPFIPVADEVVLQNQTTADQLQKMASSLSGLKILLVDDDRFNRMVASDDLSYYFDKVEIEEAENGVEAIEKYKTNDYDLILMDVQMPEMNGFEATKKIRELEKINGNGNISIIAMTASLLKAEINKCYESGMDNFIPKPYKPEELIGTMYEEMKK